MPNLIGHAQQRTSSIGPEPTTPSGPSHVRYTLLLAPLAARANNKVRWEALGSRLKPHGDAPTGLEHQPHKFILDVCAAAP